MAASEETFDSWVQDVGASASASADAGARWDENFIKLVPKQYLDVKVLEVGDSPLLMADVKDKDGNILVRKYDQLNKQIWQKLKTRQDAPPIYFICEKLITVVEGYNLEFFNYEDYQFLGAYLAEKGRLKSASWLFTEALKCETADAHINKAVFHYRSGATGVFDNYKLAKKHFEKGLATLHKLNLSSADEKQRKKVCYDCMEEIEFKTSTGFIKIFKSILRILSVHLEKDIFYVGVADRKQLKDNVTLNLITETISKFELQMFQEALDNFIYSSKIEVPDGADDLSLMLDGLAARVKAARSESELVELTATLGDAHLRIAQSKVRMDKANEEAKREAESTLLDRLSTEEIAGLKRLDAVYSLKSPRELADMAERKDIDRMFVLWVYKERQHIKMIMESLYQNPNVDPDIKKEIERKIGRVSKPRSS